MPGAGHDEVYHAVLATDSSQASRPRVAYILGALMVVPLGIVAAGVSMVTWPPPMGINVTGGTRLVYAISEDEVVPGKDEPQAGVAESRLDALVDALHRRIDPSQTQELIVRPSGQNQVEIITSAADPAAIDRIKKVVSTGGILQFRVVANSRDHQDVIDLAKAASDSTTKQRRIVLDEAGQKVGLWARVGRERPVTGDIGWFKVDVSNDTVRDADTGEILTIPAEVSDDTTIHSDEARRIRLTRYLADQGIHNIDVLLATNDGFDVSGAHLASVHATMNEVLEPNITFRLSEEGTPLFAELTSRFSPEGEFTRNLGIVLDDELLTAPMVLGQITEYGQINGRFTKKDIDFLVSILQAGALPAALVKQPVVEESYAPDPSAVQLIQRILAIGVGVLVCASIVLSVRYGWYGVAAILACVVQCVMSVSLVSVMGAIFSASLITALLVAAVAFVACNAMVCEADRCERRFGMHKTGWRRVSVLFALGVSVLLFAVAGGAGVVAHSLGGFEIRNASVALISSCLAAWLSLLALWIPAAIATVFAPTKIGTVRS